MSAEELLYTHKNVTDASAHCDFTDSYFKYLALHKEDLKFDYQVPITPGFLIEYENDDGSMMRVPCMLKTERVFGYEVAKMSYVEIFHHTTEFLNNKAMELDAAEGHGCTMYIYKLISVVVIPEEKMGVLIRYARFRKSKLSTYEGNYVWTVKTYIKC